MISERTIDIITVGIAAVVFLAMGAAMIVPWRRPDRLALALSCLLLTWGAILSLALLQTFGVLPPFLPAWEWWFVRVALDLFGIGGMVEMARAGVFRRREKRHES